MSSLLSVKNETVPMITLKDAVSTKQHVSLHGRYLWLLTRIVSVQLKIPSTVKLPVFVQRRNCQNSNALQIHFELMSSLK